MFNKSNWFFLILISFSSTYWPKEISAQERPHFGQRGYSVYGEAWYQQADARKAEWENLKRVQAAQNGYRERGSTFGNPPVRGDVYPQNGYRQPQVSARYHAPVMRSTAPSQFQGEVIDLSRHRAPSQASYSSQPYYTDSNTSHYRVVASSQQRPNPVRVEEEFSEVIDISQNPGPMQASYPGQQANPDTRERSYRETRTSPEVTADFSEVIPEVAVNQGEMIDFPFEKKISNRKKSTCVINLNFPYKSVLSIDGQVFSGGKTVLGQIILTGNFPESAFPLHYILEAKTTLDGEVLTQEKEITLEYQDFVHEEFDFDL